MRTFAMIKPDAVKKQYIGEILCAPTEHGLRIGEMRMVWWSRADAEEFYKEHEGKKFYPKLIEFMISGPLVMLVLTGKNAVEVWREVMGATNPRMATANSLRGHYGTMMPRNAVHGSDSPESADREIRFFFSRRFHDAPRCSV